MILRGRNPYECFKSDKHRLMALVSRDLRLIAVAAIAAAAGLVGTEPDLRAAILSWLA